MAAGEGKIHFPSKRTAVVPTLDNIEECSRVTNLCVREPLGD